jgi:hypothetical protein
MTFAEELERKAIDIGLNKLIKRFRGVAASMTDPSTGMHPLVLAWKTPPASIRIVTTGSETYAMALETRLDKNRSDSGSEATETPVVYFAHASEDKVTARPIVQHLISNGIDVWFDEWEIGAGDSLRRKMDEGLSNCSHFLVLLTEAALKKPWVNEEIDAGFIQKVEGKSKFIPLRMGLSLMALPPLLKTMLSPEIAPDNEPALQQLVNQILGVSAKPPLGPKPRYVQKIGALTHFSSAAITVGRLLAERSQSGTEMDPQMDLDEIMVATGLNRDDAELGTLDLIQSGMIRKTDSIGEDTIWPRGPLFIMFDEHVHDWRPADDARALAAVMVNQGDECFSPDELQQLTEWPVRRLNAALHAIKASDIADGHKYLDGTNWVFSRIYVTPQTRRAARSA